MRGFAIIYELQGSGRSDVWDPATRDWVLNASPGCLFQERAAAEKEKTDATLINARVIPYELPDAPAEKEGA